MRKDAFRLNRQMKIVLFYFFLILFIFVVVFPFYWQFLTSLKQPVELTNLRLVPNFQTASIRSYLFIFTEGKFGHYLFNSFMVASMTTAIGITISSFAAYAVARLKFRGKAILLGMVLSVSMFPQIAILSPIFIFMRDMGLRNTWFGLVIPYMTFSMPLSLWYLSSFFKTIPMSLEEAAKIDGCTPLQSFTKVIAPLALPGIFTAAILVFIFAWNEFLFALTINVRENARTMPVGIFMFQGEYTIPWVEIGAAITSVTIPLAIVVLVFQQRIISGLTTGAVKG